MGDASFAFRSQIQIYADKDVSWSKGEDKLAVDKKPVGTDHYFHIPIQSKLTRFLRAQWGRVGEHFKSILVVFHLLCFEGLRVNLIA